MDTPSSTSFLFPLAKPPPLEQIRELHILDFDGTLANTPTPEVGKRLYEAQMGNAYPFEGWWGRDESLNRSCFPAGTINRGPAYEDGYLKHAKRDDVCRVILTGRMEKLRRRVEENLVDSLGVDSMHFHELVCKKNGAKDTLSYKCAEMERMVRMYAPQRVMIWEDRRKHAEGFREFGRELKRRVESLESWEVYLVEPSSD